MMTILPHGVLVEKTDTHEKWELRHKENDALIQSEILWFDPALLGKNILEHRENFAKDGTLTMVCNLGIVPGTSERFYKETQYYNDGITPKASEEQRTLPGTESRFALHGPQTQWDKQGNRTSCGVYAYGTRISCETFHEESGASKTYEEFADDGNTMTLLDEFSAQGQLVTRCYFHDGLPVARMHFNENGQLTARKGTPFYQQAPRTLQEKIKLEKRAAKEYGAEGVKQIRRNTPQPECR